jgi:hypothetical protein
MAKAGIVLIFLSLLCVNAIGYYPPTNTSNQMQNGQQPNNFANRPLSYQMSIKTQQANKVFENVNYKKFAGENKDSFFDNGGLGKLSGEQKFKKFTIDQNASASD